MLLTIIDKKNKKNKGEKDHAEFKTVKIVFWDW